MRTRATLCHISLRPTSLTALRLVNNFGNAPPPSLWSLGHIFPSSKHTWGTQKNFGPPPEYMCFTRPCARTCAPATTVAVGRLGRRPRQAWTKVFSESPSQTSLEMYHRHPHRATPGRGASLGARARSEAIWVLLARKKCLKNADEKLFAGT